MLSHAEANAKLNLGKSSALLLEGSAHGLDILAQILLGFGIRTFHRCLTVEEARTAFESRPLDLIIADPNLATGDGYDFLKWARRNTASPNCYTPIILTTGHVQLSEVRRARDVGANFIVAKPLQPGILWQRILWIARESRAFVESPSYVGPDRRFRNLGPPPGMSGRRDGDLGLDVGAAVAPNLSDDEVSAMFKPMKVSL
jgi:DNA-binding response OmpR family regulator